ncbi:hypothetical protein F2Q69_00055485 [Brassica cretica]|uniref:Uncharacterized protein n=1 Tax=Brassica cretica TaxID=69181 RepID=A0A8S9N471_BRACR|nr:hypothetical protein F2Q69_00055485 [Brassica cretica]
MSFSSPWLARIQPLTANPLVKMLLNSRLARIQFLTANPLVKMLLNSRCVPMCWIWLRFLYHKDPNVADLSKV